MFISINDPQILPWDTQGACFKQPQMGSNLKMILLETLSPFHNTTKESQSHFNPQVAVAHAGKKLNYEMSGLLL